ncbi:SusD-like starch-binding protein associating with outer membrane [Mucilaginibacter gracilis]|uniref:SusD-like starch-binding protein associating with outer membrane n=1 Tax=Mucilaginibacter gracilis TaxID=423350 RepID=A0A495IY59_9SPHI|nr:RagB/SusD family nutrient uptake outer membrane protein [Mucilaginibacter gracilis]RKR81008.1 SusD-like starch-binding protein associating with outer membrane [Mucilaginibacter gracilis]
MFPLKWMAGSDHPEYYTQCIKACDKIINSGNFGLIDGSKQADWFNTVFFTGNSNESIFEIQFDAQLLNPFYTMFINLSGKHFLAAPRVTDVVYGNDPNPLNKDIRGDGGAVRATDYVIWKFAGTPGNSSLRAPGESYAHWFFYRYADILLLKAEALTFSNNTTGALALVKTVRARARAIAATEENPDPNNVQDVADYILRERRREFAFEGKRWFDVLRNAKRDKYTRIDLILNMIGEIAPGDKVQLIVGKYSDRRSHYLPINLDELLADKNLVQNPFYQ